MRVLLIVCLLGSTLAQPPTTTHAPRSFFQRLIDVIRDTAGVFGDAIIAKLQELGSDALHELLPQAGGQFIGGAVWDLIGAILHRSGRDISTELHDLQQKFQEVIAEAEVRASALSRLTGDLAHNSHNSTEEYLRLLNTLTESGADILHQMIQGLQNEMYTFVGKKRLAIDLTPAIEELHGIENQALALLEKVREEYAELVDPSRHPDIVF